MINKFQVLYAVFMATASMYLVWFWITIGMLFTGCSVKVLTFGSEQIKEHQDYIIGVKKTNEKENR